METKENMLCSHCKNTVAPDDDFCPYCGSFYIEGLFCKNHPESNAEGVCIICALPYCFVCGDSFSDKFLCNRHGGYEIIEGQARVMGTLISAEAEFAVSCLKQKGLHPTAFKQDEQKPGSLFHGQIFRPGLGRKGYRRDEIKILVPCQEVEEAENILLKNDLLQNHETTA